MLGNGAEHRSLLELRLLVAAYALACTAGAELQLIQMQVSARGPVNDGYVGPAAAGDSCHKMVWAMRVGIVENPDWFAPLTRNSSLDDFQRHVARLSDACPEPREARALEVRPPAASPAEKECHTSVEGEACHESVVWAMRVGVAAIPDWYAPLTKNSSFVDFQRHLHGTTRLSHVCPEPCAAQALEIPPQKKLPAQEDCHTSVKGEACYESVNSAMRTCKLAKTACYFPVTKDSSFEDFQRYLHGTARLSHVCPEPCARA